MHVILYSFTYPLKPLTQAPISIIYATHNHVLPNPDASHPEFFSADIPPRCLASGILSRQRSTLSRCLTSGIPLRRHSTRMSHIRNSSPSPLHPDVSHPEFCPANVLPYPDVSHPEFISAAIPPGCLTFGILPRQCSTLSGCLTFEIFLRRHSTRMSHTRNSTPPTFNIPPGYLTFGILPGRRSTFSGYLTSGILSADVQPSPDILHPEFCPTDVPPFSSSLEHFL